MDLVLVLLLPLPRLQLVLLQLSAPLGLLLPGLAQLLFLDMETALCLLKLSSHGCQLDECLLQDQTGGLVLPLTRLEFGIRGLLRLGIF